MTSPAPFLFNVDFAERDRVVDQVPETPMISVEEHKVALVVAEEAAYQRGVADREQTESARLGDEAQRIANAAEKILAAIDGDQLRIEADATRLALSIAQKLAPQALAQFPLVDIEALIGDCLGPLRDTPHLVVRLSEQESSSIKDVVGKMANERGFQGRFVVLGEPDFKPGDCRIEWADGGVVRDINQAVADCETKISSYFSALGTPLRELTSCEEQAELKNKPAEISITEETRIEESKNDE